MLVYPLLCHTQPPSCSFSPTPLFTPLCVPSLSPCWSCKPYLHISGRGTISLVAMVVALEYSCLASQHNSKIRALSSMPVNGKISPHRLLYHIHFPLLSFNPLSPLPLFPSLTQTSSFCNPLPRSSLPFSSALHLL